VSVSTEGTCNACFSSVKEWQGVVLDEIVRASQSFRVHPSCYMNQSAWLPPLDLKSPLCYSCRELLPIQLLMK
jgi:hypothetical protein